MNRQDVAVQKSKGGVFDPAFRSLVTLPDVVGFRPSCYPLIAPHVVVGLPLAGAAGGSWGDLGHGYSPL